MTLIAALALLLQDDKIGKDKAPAALSKCAAEMGKLKGWHYVQDNKVSGPENLTSKFEGVVKKDFATAKGTAEVYAKGPNYLVSSGGKFVTLAQLTGREALEAASFRNPSLFLDDMKALAGVATWGTDADVDGHACKVAEFAATEPVLKAQIKEFTQDLKSLTKQYGNIEAYIDTKKSTSTYKVYIGKADLLVYKIEWVLKPVIKENSLPPNAPKIDNLEAKCDLVASKFNEGLDVEIPKEIQSRFGVK